MPHPRADCVLHRGFVGAGGDLAARDGGRQRVLVPEVAVFVLARLDTPELLAEVFDLRRLEPRNLEHSGYVNQVLQNLGQLSVFHASMASGSLTMGEVMIGVAVMTIAMRARANRVAVDIR